MQKIVLDTNVLLVSISDRSKLHWIFKSLLETQYTSIQIASSNY
jgi:rRNA-processing protein FCF1